MPGEKLEAAGAAWGWETGTGAEPLMVVLSAAVGMLALTAAASDGVVSWDESDISLIVSSEIIQQFQLYNFSKDNGL